MRLSTSHGHDFFHDYGFFQGHNLYDETGIHRGWLATIGIFYLLLGAVGLGMVTMMTLVSVLFFGSLALVGGIVQLLQSFTSHGWRNIVAGALFGLFYIFAGVVIILNPVASSLMLTLFLAGALLALGVVRIAFSLQHRTHKFWIWSIISGLLSIVIGVMIIAQWPVTGLWAIGLFVSLEMIFHGAAAVGLAVEKKSTLA